MSRAFKKGAEALIVNIIFVVLCDMILQSYFLKSWRGAGV